MNYLSIDVGGTEIKYAKITENGEFLEKGAVASTVESSEKFQEIILGIYNKFKGEIKGIAMSLPGKIDTENGFVHFGGSLEFNNGRYVAKELSSLCDNVSVILENDAKCAALAEAKFGSLSDVDDGIVVTLGTGIGGGIIKDKKIHRGKEFTAGEFSFLISGEYPNGKLKCWMMDGGVKPGLLQPYAELKSIEKDSIDGRKFFDAVKENDSDAIEVLDRYCYNLAIQLMNLQHIYNPEKIALGGGISAQDTLIEFTRKNVEKVISNMPIALSKPIVVRCKFRNDANLLGALSVYKDMIG